jgi:hypothetical protein
MACTGLRDSTADTVRPLPMCVACQHWQRQSGAPIRPHVVCFMRDGGMVIDCSRRIAAEPLPEAG